MGLSPGSLTNQGTGSLVCVNQLTHKVSNTHWTGSSERLTEVIQGVTFKTMTFIAGLRGDGLTAPWVP